MQLLPEVRVLSSEYRVQAGVGHCKKRAHVFLFLIILQKIRVTI